MAERQAIVAGVPHFMLPLTLAEINLLIELSQQHDDWTCQDAGRDIPEARKRGLLQVWKMQTEFSLGKEEEPAPCAATFREIDLCLKILEIAPYSRHLDQVAVRRLSDFLYGALRTSNATSASWTASFTQEIPG